IHCGLKKRKKDLAFILSDSPCSAAGTFTLNKVKAAPLVYSQEIIKSGKQVRAVLINSGNANAATGKQGYLNVLRTVNKLSQIFKLKEDEVLVSSTGVIGQQLNMDILLKGIEELPMSLSESGGIEAAKAIMTTDKFEKHFALKINLDDRKSVSIGGICKGSGMIMPNMATMLAFITTDALIDRTSLQEIISEVVDETFNKISVDGETSTNDMVIILANGKSGVDVTSNNKHLTLFKNALFDLCKKMAKAIVSDGEGATKLVKIKIINARDYDSANRAAKAVVNSPLVKTAIAGADANWGRILSAIGNSGIEFDPEQTEIYFDQLKVLDKGYNTKFSEEKAKSILSKKEFTIAIDLNNGEKNTEWFTTDFTEDYIKINAYYRT
ncbi:MAG: bifunctional glutamate N-acetyltransferase/amino-acid acetyltransferase ArgJ, partial [Ignavibacteria bacterium]